MKPFTKCNSDCRRRRISGVFPVSVGDARGHTVGCKCSCDAGYHHTWRDRCGSPCSAQGVVRASQNIRLSHAERTLHHDAGYASARRMHPCSAGPAYIGLDRKNDAPTGHGRTANALRPRVRFRYIRSKCMSRRSTGAGYRGFRRQFPPRKHLRKARPDMDSHLSEARNVARQVVAQN
jgi:hypothetical protein